MFQSHRQQAMYVAMDTQQKLRILQSVCESDITSFTCSRHISMLLAADVRVCVLVSCPAV